jgi:hypothetical protein
MKNYRLYINNKSHEFDNYEEFKKLIKMKKYKLFIDDKSYGFDTYNEFRDLFNSIITLKIRKYKDFVLHFYADKNDSNIEYKKILEILSNNKNKNLLYKILMG